MAGQKGAVGDDHMIAHQAIVADVAVDHQEIMGTHHRVLGDLVGTLHGAIFTKNVMGTEAKTGGFVLVFEILRGIADDTTGVELIMAPHGEVACQVDVRSDGALFTDLDMFIHH